MTSCNLINSLFAPYIGNWELVVGDGKSELTITKDTISMSVSAKDNGEWVVGLMAKGDFKVDGSKFEYTFRKRRLWDDGAGALGPWENIPSPATAEGTWSVDGNELTFTYEDGTKDVFNWVGY